MTIRTLGYALVAAYALGCDAPSTTTGQSASTLANGDDTTDGGTDPRRGRTPSPGAIEACATAADGDACQVDCMGGAMSGVCREALDAGVLVCLVDRPPGEARTVTGTCQTLPGIEGLVCAPANLRPPAPPAEAVQACTGHAPSDACSFTGRRGGAIGGTCLAFADGTLVCAPTDLRRAPPQAALDACGGHAPNDACSFQFQPHGDPHGGPSNATPATP